MIGKLQCRVAAYCTTLALHFIAMTLVIQAAKASTSKQLEDIFSVLWTYITIWNLVIQSFYAVMGLICDIPALIEINEKSGFLEHLRWYRSVLLYGILWPCGFFIYIVFWPIYLYDRELIYPSIVDEVLSATANHLMHSTILPIIIWEYIFAERRVTKPDKLTSMHWIILLLTFKIVMYASYYVTGRFPYPMFAKTYNTVYMVPLYLYLLTLCAISYFIQWYIPTVLRINEKWYIQSITK